MRENIHELEGREGERVRENIHELEGRGGKSEGKKIRGSRRQQIHHQQIRKMISASYQIFCINLFSCEVKFLFIQRISTFLDSLADLFIFHVYDNFFICRSV